MFIKKTSSNVIMVWETYKNVVFYHLWEIEAALKDGDIVGPLEEIEIRRKIFVNPLRTITNIAKQKGYDVAHLVGGDWAMLLDSTFNVEFYKLNI